MRYLIAALALAGLVVSSLALRIHLMDPAAAPPCAVSEHWDCGTVNHGKYSVFPPLSFDETPGTVHVPVALLGIVGYALIGVFAVMGRLRIVLELARVGFFFAAFLTYIEKYIIEDVVYLLRVVPGDYCGDSGSDGGGVAFAEEEAA